MPVEKKGGKDASDVTDKTDEPIQALDALDIAFLKNYGSGPYTAPIKKAEGDLKDILKRVNDVCGVKESDTGLAPPSRWDLVSDKQMMQEEQPLQVVVWQGRGKGEGGQTGAQQGFMRSVDLHAVPIAPYSFTVTEHQMMMCLLVSCNPARLWCSSHASCSEVAVEHKHAASLLLQAE